MLTLPLDPTDDRAAPVFKDVASCAAWLTQFQLTNLQQAHSYLLTQLNEFNRFPMQGLERYRTLEALRETVDHIQEDLAKKLVGKALPLGEHEFMTFMSITQMWQALVTGYQRCLQAFLAGDKKLATMGAMLCERCLQYSGSTIFEHIRTGYECHPKFWHQLHDLYAFAEEQSLHEIEVKDELERYSLSSSCRSMYLKTLLACYARPAELSRTQLKLLDRWLVTWSKELRLETRYSLSKGDAQPLAVDLAGKQGLQAVANTSHHAQMRYIPMVPLSKLLRVKIILLQQGTSLDQVGLGDLPSISAGIELLTFLLECWCEDDKSRAITRNLTSKPVQFGYTPEMIFALLNGKHAMPHKDRLMRKQIETFGRVLDSANATFEPELEGWVLDDESMMGAKLTRHQPGPGRLNLHQLVAVRQDESQPYKLGAVAWLHVSVGGLLQIGVGYVPGVPEPVHVQLPGGVPQAAFLMPEAVTLRTPPSLLVPRQIFQPGVMLQVIRANNDKMHVKMGISVTRGFDYERISYT
ncbi:MAG: hypothetical protein PHI29_10615 [Gallionella sp.]|nr:hypothetical protein [Gallionella sp.]